MAEISAKDVMIPRTQMVAFPDDLSTDELLAELREWSDRIEAPRLAPREPVEEKPVAARGDSGLLELEALDYTGLLSRCSGDRELAVRLMRKMQRQSADYLASLTRAVASNDADEAAAIAHKLKGAAGAIGLRRIQALAGTMERDFRQGDLDAAEAILAALAELLADYSREVEQRLSSACTEPA